MQKLWSSFVKAQSEMKNPVFDSKNPHFKSDYASLSSVREAVLPILNKYGISIIQQIKKTDRGIECVTMLIHESGETFSSDPLEIPLTKIDAHGVGSAITYGRRYQLQCICGVVGDYDDDANSVVQIKSNDKKNEYKKYQQYSPPTSNENYKTNTITQDNKPEKTLSESEMKLLADKTIYYSDKVNECKNLEDLEKTWNSFKQEIRPFEHAKEYSECFIQVKSVTKLMKISLSK